MMRDALDFPANPVNIGALAIEKEFGVCHTIPIIRNPKA